MTGARIDELGTLAGHEREATSRPTPPSGRIEFIPGEERRGFAGYRAQPRRIMCPICLESTETDRRKYCSEVCAIRARIEQAEFRRWTPVAYHESGHALIAVMKHIPLWHVSIRQTGDIAGQCVTRRRATSVTRRLNETSQSDRRTINQRMDVIMFSLAGMVAECLHTGHYNLRGASGDLECARVYAANYFGAESMPATLRHALEKTIGIVSAPAAWAAVTALADELCALRRRAQRQERWNRRLGREPDFFCTLEIESPKLRSIMLDAMKRVAGVPPLWQAYHRPSHDLMSRRRPKLA